MKILYYSVHAVLEDDEVRMLKQHGHDVFPLGVNFGFTALQAFRESIVFNETEHELLRQFHATGCFYRFGTEPLADMILTSAFVALFDVVIVMHDLDFIEQFWPSLSQRPVIWRTIGQNIDDCETKAAKLKSLGMHIVRYSPQERLSSAYCGETAMIRFGKNPDDYGPWRGDVRQILTFSNLFEQRYPAAASLYREIVENLPPVLGGVGNETLPDQIGFLSHDSQNQYYRSSRVYFYCSGPEIPYTLNFIEAMMSGLPIVAFDFQPRHKYYEIPDLLRGGAGFVVQDVESARNALQQLLHDDVLAVETSTIARTRAIELFSFEHIGGQWNTLLEQIC